MMQSRVTLSYKIGPDRETGGKAVTEQVNYCSPESWENEHVNIQITMIKEQKCLYFFFLSLKIMLELKVSIWCIHQL